MGRARRSSDLHVVVGSAIAPMEPDQPLGVAGRALWDKITREYDFSDSAGRAMLCQAAQNLDRAEALRARIEEEGIVAGGRPHGALNAEQVARNAVTRTLKQLGLLDQPRRDRPGRPPKSAY